MAGAIIKAQGSRQASQYGHWPGGARERITDDPKKRQVSWASLHKKNAVFRRELCPWPTLIASPSRPLSVG